MKITQGSFVKASTEETRNSLLKTKRIQMKLQQRSAGFTLNINLKDEALQLITSDKILSVCYIISPHGKGVRKQHYFSMHYLSVRPSSVHLSVTQYADVVWDNCNHYEANELEKIQTEAVRIVTGSTWLVSIDSLRTKTGWEMLASRRQKHTLLVFFFQDN